jgi:hypothetical protein
MHFVLAALFLLFAPGINGVYEGTWKSADSATSGAMRLQLEKNPAGEYHPIVSFTVNDSNTPCEIKKATIQEDKLSISCSFSTGDGDLIAFLDGELDGETINGKYVAKAGAEGEPVASGTWTATRLKK